MRVDAYATPQNISQLSRGWLERIRLSVAPREHLRPDPSQSALLVVDMVRYFASPDGRCFLPASPAIVPAIQKLAQVFRNLGRPVIYTRHCHTGDGDLGMLGKFFSDYIHAGRPESEIIEPLTPAPTDIVFTKNTYDAFWNTPLQKILEEMGVRQVLISGVLTHMCCETTARAAFCRGFEVYPVIDAMASASEEKHLSSLKNMADAVAVLQHSEEILNLC